MIALPNASWTEIFQLLLALVAVSLGFWRLWIAVENTLYITNTASTDLKRLVAEAQVMGEMFRLFTYGCLLAIAIVCVLLSPPDATTTPPTPDTLQAVLVRFGLVTVTMAMIADSLTQEYRRRLFFKQVHERLRDNT